MMQISTQQLPAMMVGFQAVWEGTPFMAYSRAPGAGGGVDCVHLAEAAALNMGLLDEPLEFPEYSTDWGMHNSGNVIKEFMKKCGILQRMDYYNLALGREDFPMRAGDFLGFNTGSGIGHMGIMLDGEKVIHCYQGKGVVVHRLTDRFFKTILRPAEVYRPRLNSSL